MEFEFFSFVAVLVTITACFLVVKIEIDALERSIKQLKCQLEQCNVPTRRIARKPKRVVVMRKSGKSNG